MGIAAIKDIRLGGLWAPLSDHQRPIDRHLLTDELLERPFLSAVLRQPVLPQQAGPV